MENNMRKFLAFLLLNIGFLCAQEAPEGFEYNQSRFQAFNLYLSGDIGGSSLDEGDWIAAFNEDVCVGSAQRLGVPMFYGGPHAGFFACHEKYNRKMPGRIIGRSNNKSNEENGIDYEYNDNINESLNDFKLVITGKEKSKRKR